MAAGGAVEGGRGLREGPAAAEGRDGGRGAACPEDIHVLLVDDERLSRVVVGSLLRKCNYQVTEAGSGLEALDILRSSGPGTFNIILTDVMMPDVDGIELLRHVRGDDSLNNLPVVMMSANEHTETVFECIRGGAEDYLLKPVTKKEVQHMWQHVWRRQQQNAMRVPNLGSDEGVDEVEARGEGEGCPADLLCEAEDAPGPSSEPVPRPALMSAPSLPPPQPSPPEVLRRAASAAAPGAGVSDPPSSPEAERRRSGAKAGTSGRAAPPGRGPSSVAGRGGGGAARPAPSVSLAAYFARRGATVAPADSFRILVGVLKLLQQVHARGQTLGCVRPSVMRLGPGGAVFAGGSPPAPGEDALYASPEELLNGAASPASDIYSLGVLFFELFNPLGEPGARGRTLGALRHRILPLPMLQGRQQEAAFLLALLHPDPSARPKVVEIARSSLLAALHRTIVGGQRGTNGGSSGAGQGPGQGPGSGAAKRDSAMPGAGPEDGPMSGDAEAEADRDVLIDFLRLLRRTKVAAGEHLKRQLGALDADIAEVLACLERAVADAPGGAAPAALAAALSARDAARGNQAGAATPQAAGPSTAGPLGRKRDREPPLAELEQRGTTLANSPGALALRGTRSTSPRAVAKWARVAGAFPAVDGSFFAQRDAAQRRLGGIPGLGRGLPESAAGGVGAGTGGGTELGRGAGGEPPRLAPGHLSAFCEDLSRFVRFSELRVRAALRYGDLLSSADMVCSTAFDRDDEFFATAGVSRRIKVYAVGDVERAGVALHYPVADMPAGAKLSCVAWNGYIKPALLAADYDGGIALWDAAVQAPTARFEEHAKRVWSVDFSQTDPTRFLSGSDDGTVRLWSIRERSAAAAIDARANVCSVQFSPASSHIVAFGSANFRVYLYDLRSIKMPLAVIGGHAKAVSYVRWMGGGALVSASTDNHLKLWDVDAACALQGAVRPRTVFKGHTNEKNFVGLSVSPEGYVACGSEDNAVYAYFRALPSPMAIHRFAPGDQEDEGGARHFVSSVTWTRRGDMLLAANSQGTIKLLELA